MSNWDDDEQNRSMSAGFARRDKEFAGWPVGDMWPHREIAVQFEVPPGVDPESYKSRINATCKQVEENMRASLYGDGTNLRAAKKPSRFKIWRERIHDAWQVLLGRAEIGDGW